MIEMNYKKTELLFLFTIMAILIVVSCKKEVAQPDNPYDEVDYGTTTTTEDTLDPNSITALHRDIFFPKCATPGCHDGNFEPNFLTVQSTYSTLVYQTLVKTDSTGYFLYRVHPYDTSRSWLHERLTTDDQTLGRMPLYANHLSQTEMDRINTWIMDGAKDVNGNNAVYPDVQPNIEYYFALNEISFNSIVISYNRLNNVMYNPFLTEPDSGFYIMVSITDDSTALSKMTNNKLKLSKSETDFSNATVCNASYITLGTDAYWYAYVSTAAYSPGDTVYMRYYTNDGKHTEDVEMPKDDDELYYYLYWSFYVQ